MKYIGITGPRRAGKDTFAQLLKDVCPQPVIKYAFADALKNDLAELFKDKFNADIFTLEGELKETLRPIMISYGCVWRSIDPLHWVKDVQKSIGTWDSMGQFVHCITDVRFRNEAETLKNKYGDKFILISINRIGGPEPTEEEKRNIPEIKPLVDCEITWETEPDLIKAREIVRNFYSKSK